MKRVYQTQLYVLIVLFVSWNQGLRRQITMIYIVRTLLCTAPVFFFVRLWTAPQSARRKPITLVDVECMDDAAWKDRK